VTTTKDRSRNAALERRLADLDGFERRVLADLRLAGWRFQSVAAARRQLGTIRAVTRFNTDHDADALAAALTSNKRRTA